MSHPGKVLLTGGSGFIASHILDLLLDSGFTVVATVRSAARGQAIVEAVAAAHRGALSFAVVADVAAAAAFDAVLQAEPPFDYVVHTATPYQLRTADPVRDFLDPAVGGTRGLLAAVQRWAPRVRRVVLTSSSAAMLDPRAHAAVYDETCWRPVTWADARRPDNAYEAAKVLAERAAWACVRGTDDVGTASELGGDDAVPATSFDLVVINCTYTFGPVPRWLPGLDAVNASNQRIRDLVLGRWRRDADDDDEPDRDDRDHPDDRDRPSHPDHPSHPDDAHTPPRSGMPPTRPVFTWVDVRDVAHAHVRALQAPAAANRRFYVVAGHFSNGRLAAVVRDAWQRDALPSALQQRIPPPADTPDDLPADVYGFDNRRARDVLGLVRYRTLAESVMDTVDSLLALEAREHGAASGQAPGGPS